MDIHVMGMTWDTIIIMITMIIMKTAMSTGKRWSGNDVKSGLKGSGT